MVYILRAKERSKPEQPWEKVGTYETMAAAEQGEMRWLSNTQKFQDSELHIFKEGYSNESEAA